MVADINTSVFKWRLVCFNIQILNWKRYERSKRESAVIIDDALYQATWYTIDGLNRKRYIRNPILIWSTIYINLIKPCYPHPNRKCIWTIGWQNWINTLVRDIFMEMTNIWQFAPTSVCYVWLELNLWLEEQEQTF